MMLIYNAIKCVICHNSGIESISKFFRLVINDVYSDGSVLVCFFGRKDETAPTGNKRV